MISVLEAGRVPESSSFEREVSTIFSAAGVLSAAPGYEWRPQQQEMAVAVARTLSRGGHLIIEAGTGVGKSFAYLVPAILHAVRGRRKAIVSTHTINLQEQLIYKDLPAISERLGLDFTAALLKGRQNYCCGTRLDKALDQADGLFTSDQRRELERIREWSATTKEGSLSDFVEQPGAVLWSQICSERNICTPKTCGGNPRCFYQAARKRVQAANVIVLNHTLFFTLLGGLEEAEERETGYLFLNDFLILDEAHTIESIASKHIGFSVSQFGLRSALLRLYNPRTKKGLFQMLRQPQGVAAVAELLPVTDRFFERVAQACQFKGGREFRVREPGLVDAADLTGGIARLLERATNAASKCADELTKAEILDLCRRLRDARTSVAGFLNHEARDHVYWVEQTGRREALLNLHAAPVDLAQCLRRLLFRDSTCAVLTSATLSVGGADLRYFCTRIGADGIPTQQAGSPFDYARQMTLHLVRRMPDPRDPGYEDALEQWIAHFARMTGGRAFVLFTSYATMSRVAHRMESFFSEQGWRLLVQGGTLSRTRMIVEFKQSRGEAVLFGTDSFWGGVDVQGDALSNVIITRLPFATPDNPLIEARLETIEARGGDAFQNYSLPEAILKLRQGVGRLIRSKTDRGIVVILDSRIVTKPYGRAFLRALPECPVEIH